MRTQLYRQWKKRMHYSVRSNSNWNSVSETIRRHQISRYFWHGRPQAFYLWFDRLGFILWPDVSFVQARTDDTVAMMNLHTQASGPRAISWSQIMIVHSIFCLIISNDSVSGVRERPSLSQCSNELHQNRTSTPHVLLIQVELSESEL